MHNNDVVVVGAGIAGLAAAVALQKVGIPVRVLEKASDLRNAGAAINVATNGWRAMDALGIAHLLRESFTEITRYTIMRETGQVLKTLQVSECHEGPHEVRGCVRNDLVKALADMLSPGTIRFDCKVNSIQHTNEGCSLHLDDGVLACKVVVGADGIYSKVRGAIGGAAPEYAGWSTYRGMATFMNGIPDIFHDFCSIYGGKEGSIAGLYSLDETRCYYFYGFPVSKVDADKIQRADRSLMKCDLLHRIDGFPDQLIDAVNKTSDSDMYFNHIADRVILPGEAWGKSLVTLIGDAAHPTTPTLGQGGNMALEDGLDLAASLKDAMQSAALPWERLPNEVVENALRSFEEHRSARCAPLVAKAAQGGRLMMKKRSWMGLALRDLYLYFYSLSPSHHLEHTLWAPSCLE